MWNATRLHMTVAVNLPRLVALKLITWISPSMACLTSATELPCDEFITGSLAFHIRLNGKGTYFVEQVYSIEI